MLSLLWLLHPALRRVFRLPGRNEHRRNEVGVPASMRCWVTFRWVALSLVVTATGTQAQQAAKAQKITAERARSFGDHVVDRISLKDGTHIWGMAVSEKPAKMVVRTAWLKDKLPELFTGDLEPLMTKAAADNPLSLVSLLQTEIDRVSKETPDDRRRTGLLKEVRDRVSPEPGQLPKFVSLEVAKKRLRNLELQKEFRRELCRFAILNDLVDYEEAHWKTVTDQLQAIPPEARRLTLPVSVSAEDDLLKVLAAVDITLGTSTRMVQSGNSLFDEGEQLDLAAVMNSMLGGNVQSLLNELLSEGAVAPAKASVAKDLPPSARAAADRKQHSTIVLSAFEFDLPGGTATVSKRLFRKKPDGTWTLLLTVSGTSTVADVREGQADAIANDPQVDQISDVVSGLGLGGEQFKTSLKMGAVVQNAMANGEEEFGSTVQSYLNGAGLSQSFAIPEILLE